MPSKEEMSKELLFVDALKAVGQNEDVGYLGDKEVVESHLRTMAAEVLEAIPYMDEGDSLSQAAYRKAASGMRVFLREDSPGFKGVRGWNKPGAVDVFAAKWAGIKADRPIQRLVGVFLILFGEVIEMEQLAQKESPEQWKFQVDAIFDKYAYILIGISPPDQLLMF